MLNTLNPPCLPACLPACLVHPFLRQIRVRRRTIYYFNNLIGPCVLIASMVRPNWRIE